MIVLGAENEYEAIRKQASVLYSIPHGEVIAETKPSETNITFGDVTEKVHV